MLDAAERPMIVVGGSGWSDPLRQRLQDFVAAQNIPVANSFRCQDFFDNEHPAYAGDLGLGVNPALVRRIDEADCLLVIGARMGEMTTGGFSLLGIPVPRQRMIHVHAGAEELGHIYRPELAINASSARFVDALAQFMSAANEDGKRRKQVEAAHREYLDWNASIRVAGSMQLSDVVHDIRRLTPDDAIICNGAGNNTSWLHRFHRYRQYRTQLAPTSGTMGYGLPAAVAAKLRYPDRCVVAFAGDGDFMMNGQELATAMQYQVGIIVIVVNNGIYATIRMHQEREYPRRVIGTEMVNPDFVALAEAHGARAERVESSDAFADAFTRCRDAGRLALIELRLDPEILTPTATVQGLRGAKH
jgi:acetolactate synthase-1/2/3 large subunit